MKNKFRSVMPRLIGATLVAGVATFIIATVFKLLLALTLLTGAVALIARSAGRRQRLFGKYAHGDMPGLGNTNAYGNTWDSFRQPGNGYAAQRGATIVPVN